MTTAKIFENGRSQAVRLPKEYRFSEDEVLISKVGEIVMLIPKSLKWDGFLAELICFPMILWQRGGSSRKNRRVNSYEIYAGHKHMYLYY